MFIFLIEIVQKNIKIKYQSQPILIIVYMLFYFLPTFPPNTFIKTKLCSYCIFSFVSCFTKCNVCYGFVPSFLKCISEVISHFPQCHFNSCPIYHNLHKKPPIVGKLGFASLLANIIVLSYLFLQISLCPSLIVSS